MTFVRPSDSKDHIYLMLSDGWGVRLHRVFYDAKQKQFVIYGVEETFDTTDRIAQRFFSTGYLPLPKFAQTPASIWVRRQPRLPIFELGYNVETLEELLEESGLILSANDNVSTLSKFLHQLGRFDSA